MKKVIFIGVLAILSDFACAMDPSLTLIKENNSSVQAMAPVDLIDFSTTSDVQITDNEITVNSPGKQVTVKKMVDLDGKLYTIEEVEADISNLTAFIPKISGPSSVVNAFSNGILRLNTGQIGVQRGSGKKGAVAEVQDRIKYLQEAIAVAERHFDELLALANIIQQLSK